MKTGTITLTTASAAAIFDEELQGQFSDGMWENARPHDHWKFWCNLTVEVGTENKVTTDVPWMCTKRSYGISSLYDCVGDRMVKIGRMAKATGKVVSRGICEYMPATLEEWRECKASGKWQYEFVGAYMEKCTDEMAVAFYSTTYTLKDVKADVKLIKAAMKTVPE